MTHGCGSSGPVLGPDTDKNTTVPAKWDALLTEGFYSRPAEGGSGAEAVTPWRRVSGIDPRLHTQIQIKHTADFRYTWLLTLTGVRVPRGPTSGLLPAPRALVRLAVLHYLVGHPGASSWYRTHWYPGNLLTLHFHTHLRHSTAHLTLRYKCGSGPVTCDSGTSALCLNHTAHT